jgi:aldose 1-epimerase
MTEDPTGEQIHLRATFDTAIGTRDVTAHVAQVGASLRGLTVDGLDLVAPYPDGSPTPASSGRVLVPWPNRIRDGRWHDLYGVEHHLPITEPARHNAIHGLLATEPYLVHVSSSGDRAVLGARIRPTEGYPASLDTVVAYELTEHGITVTHEIVNVGDDAALLAVGAHPYLCLGSTPASDLVLRSPGASVIEVDDQMIPTATVPVDAETDLRDGRVLADLTLDTGYTDLARDPDGRVRHTLTDPEGRSVVLWQDEAFGWVQLYTTTSYPGRPFTLAVEPMTAPADAFNSGLGLRALDLGETFTASWGIERR